MKLSPTYNLAALHPELAEEWHPAKNGDLTPDQVTPRSSRKVWWKCIREHEWKARLADRTGGTGCPYCAGKKTSKEYNLAVKHPELAREWHPTRNGDRTPDQFTPGSGKKVWWRCSREHEWKAVVSSRTNGSGCPYCSGFYASEDHNLAVKHPEIAKQWHATRNGDLTPDQRSPGSSMQVWWKCSRGHEWEAALYSRTSGTGCPYCYKERARTMKSE